MAVPLALQCGETGIGLIQGPAGSLPPMVGRVAGQSGSSAMAPKTRSNHIEPCFEFGDRRLVIRSTKLLEAMRKQNDRGTRGLLLQPEKGTLPLR